ncbi:MAG: hypothetical protein QOK43_519 [Acidimicrobiaceae bacterium]|nr:hypothetical protein [Acidimicrobiaceae bacterium]
MSNCDRGSVSGSCNSDAALCGCCEGVQVATPVSEYNRPGLRALRYRAGTHGSFLSSMLARLSAREFEGLTGLTTRDPSDPAIALLDAWASIADVLTFYQERIANEGFLGTATERRSVVELARLVGYESRPGVAAGTHLAFELEQGHEETLTAGLRVQSMPGPGQLPQVFETSEPLDAKAAFNNLAVRTTRPQAITAGTAADMPRLWLAGTATRLQPNDALVIVIGEGSAAVAFLRFVQHVEEDHAAGRTLVVLQRRVRRRVKPRWARHRSVDEVLDLVAAGAHAPARSDPRLPEANDTRLRLAQVLRPALKDVLYAAWSQAVVSKPSPVRVYAMRVKASVFGHNAVAVPTYNADGQLEDQSHWHQWTPSGEDGKRLYLDTQYPGVATGGIVALVSPNRDPDLHGFAEDLAVTVDSVSHADYGMAAKTTRLTFHDEGWIAPLLGPSGPGEARSRVLTMEQLRSVVVYAQNDPLELTDEPVTEDVCRANLELADLYEGLTPGRRLVVSGERADLPGIRGVVDAELVTVAEVRQGPVGANGAMRPGDRNHTFVLLAGGGLRHCYARQSVKVYGNVVHATHGETRSEVLGSGDGRKRHQSFTLRSAPLTHVSASTPSGVEAAMEVRVDDVRWPHRPWLLDVGPTEPGYVLRIDGSALTTVIAGDGVEGRRLPTGAENIRSRYRVGLGAQGNVAAGGISLLVDKPLSVRGVVNPMAATGGADAETTDQARAHVPVPIRALDRLVSTVDYASFAQAFAGVGQATADRLSDGRRQVVVVTVVGPAGGVLTATSDVVVNLRRALRRFGDPSVTVRVLVADRLVLHLAADVRIGPDRDWAVVAPLIRQALLSRFDFEGQALGQDVAESEVLACIHQVAGVMAAGLTTFASHPEGGPLPNGYSPARRIVARPARREGTALRPAEHVCLAPELPELLVLGQATS